MGAKGEEERKTLPRYSQLLEGHIARGTGTEWIPELKGCWTLKRFASEVGVSVRQLRKWRNGEERPIETNRLAIIRVLFGKTEPPEAIQLNEAYKIWGNLLEDDLLSDWIFNSTLIDEDFVELSLEPPVTGNEPGVILLNGNLITGEIEIKEGDTIFRVGFKECILIIESGGSYMIQKRSMLGERPCKVVCERIPRGVKLTGPKNRSGNLTGDLLGEDYIANLREVGTGSSPVVVKIYVNRMSINPKPAGWPGSNSVENLSSRKEAVINAVMTKSKEKGPHGSVFAVASMKKKGRKK